MLGGRVSALERLKKSSVSVKDIASQLWCEKQMELYITHGVYNTPAMAKGAAMHEVIQKEVQIALAAEPTTYPDRLYKWAYENCTSIANLPKDGYCREIRVYGSLNGFKVAGQVDELRMSEGKVMVVEDKTINADSGIVSLRVDSDKIQVAIYRKLIEEIRAGAYTYDNFARSFGIVGKMMSPEFREAVNLAGIKPELQTLEGIHKKMFEMMKNLPMLSDVVGLKYLDRKTERVVNEMIMPYDPAALTVYLTDAMKYWSGEREPRPVPEDQKWKCNMCKFFGKECTVWWKK